MRKDLVIAPSQKPTANQDALPTVAPFKPTMIE
jgi:hypothetical protein